MDLYTASPTHSFDPPDLYEDLRIVSLEAYSETFLALYLWHLHEHEAHMDAVAQS